MNWVSSEIKKVKSNVKKIDKEMGIVLDDYSELEKKDNSKYGLNGNEYDRLDYLGNELDILEKRLEGLNVSIKNIRKWGKWLGVKK